MFSQLLCILILLDREAFAERERQLLREAAFTYSYTQMNRSHIEKQIPF